jgi:hypothetical protein
MGMARLEQRKVLNIDPGLFLLRYATAEDDTSPPSVRVMVDHKQEYDIFLVLQPNQDSAVLPRPGSSLVVMATNRGQLFIEVTPSRRDGSSAATIKVEPLKVIPVPKATSEVAVEGGGVRLRGHLAGIGDVSARGDEWLAGPAAPCRIEGFAIEWPDKPDDLHIRYSVKTARPQAVSSRTMDLGAYAGTRGCALPIIGVIVEISGPAVSRYVISADAIFLGSPRLHAGGTRVVLAGPTGREPLVGLRLGMEELNTKRQTAALPVRTGHSSGRVRVFRSSAQPESSLLS